MTSEFCLLLLHLKPSVLLTLQLFFWKSLLLFILWCYTIFAVLFSHLFPIRSNFPRKSLKWSFLPNPHHFFFQFCGPEQPWFLLMLAGSVASVLSDSSGAYGLLPPRRLCPWDSPGKNTEWAAMPSSRDLPEPGIELSSPESPALQMDSLPNEPPGKPRFLLRNQ